MLNFVYFFIFTDVTLVTIITQTVYHVTVTSMVPRTIFVQ
jgi:hypothetical protein